MELQGKRVSPFQGVTLGVSSPSYQKNAATACFCDGSLPSED